MDALKPLFRTLAAVALLAWLAACDPSGKALLDLRLAQLTPNASTEADVRKLYGEPDSVSDLPGGGKGLVYPLGPEGAVTLLVRLDGGGRYQGADNLLTPENFSLVHPGMSGFEVRRLLGRPGTVQQLPMQRQVVWSWRYLDQPNNRMFVVTLDPSGMVLSAATEDDPRLQGGR
ncbi:MAG TPA: outer membrane protein assembly factor BamE [Burkholderiaceae bacterium]|nr:outer membrane protein assembly factor BamE [Burkholderiaceae bacterium]HRZ02564.1 outer membrane protein assembly factor BamE [Burkholderiaceae bacterium]